MHWLKASVGKHVSLGDSFGVLVSESKSDFMSKSVPKLLCKIPVSIAKICPAKSAIRKELRIYFILDFNKYSIKFLHNISSLHF